MKGIRGFLRCLFGEHYWSVVNKKAKSPKKVRCRCVRCGVEKDFPPKEVPFGAI